MTIQRRFCANHSERPAIGLCVMTGIPICGECSTRYEGVNYSRQGLELLRKQRADATAGRRSRARVVAYGLVWCVAPLLLYLMYLGYVAGGNVVASLLHGEF